MPQGSSAVKTLQRPFNLLTFSLSYGMSTTSSTACSPDSAI